MSEIRTAERPRETGRTDRRAAITDAAIAILGLHGSRGLTHRAIDKHLDYPEGTTSAYFRRREDLVMATVKALFEADFDRINDLFDTLVNGDTPLTVDWVAQWHAEMAANVRKAQGRAGMLARYECFLLAKRNPDTDRLLNESFMLRTDKIAEIFRRLGATAPLQAAIRFEMFIRGLFLTVAFMPDWLDENHLADEAAFLREINAALQS